MKESILNLFDQALQERPRQGIDHLALTALVQSSRGVSVFQGAVDSVEIADEIKIGVWAGSGGKWGTASLEMATENALREAVWQAHAASKFNDPEPDFSLAPPETTKEKKNIPQETSLPGMKDIEKMALENEKRMLGFSPLITNVPQSDCGYHIQSRLFANSQGSRFCEDIFLLSLGASVMAAGKDRRTVNVHERHYFPLFTAVDWDLLTRDAAGEVIARLEPRRIRTGPYPVLFDKRTAAQILGTFVPVFSGDLLYRNLTRLKGRLGESVASSAVSILDAADRGLVPHLYDAEGTLCRAKPIVEKGIFKNFLHNRNTGRKAGAETSGNATGGQDALPGVSSMTLSWEGDLADEAHLIEGLGTGLLIKELHGASASPVSGDFSFGALGYWVEKGKISHPVADFTVAGNFFDLLQKIRGLGRELDYFSPHLLGSTGGRMLSVSELAISGD